MSHAAEPLVLETVRHPDAVVVALHGRLDGATSERFHAWIEQQLAPDDRAVLVDASRLSGLSSAGLRELLHLAKRLAPHGTMPVIAGLSPTTGLAIEISGFDSLYHREPDVEAGLAMLRGKRSSKPGLLDRLLHRSAGR